VFSLGIVEIGIVLGLLDLLFLTFVVIQVRYLFGGAGRVAATAGLTHTEYARRGFFELVTVTALALPSCSSPTGYSGPKTGLTSVCSRRWPGLWSVCSSSSWPLRYSGCISISKSLA
jgi:Domain of unknown function (DUF4173)